MKLKILIIDDERFICETLCAAFELGGFFVDVAYSGEEGLEKFGIGDYDAVISDISLPGMDGYEVVRQIRM